ncbi:unnamed protein product [Sphagnum jensenii]|uniref:Uncharacterized protein n=1 Tax=Sphagnum jensenii TaxID=128206 RepID=A0ABP0WC87_9BRYO
MEEEIALSKSTWYLCCFLHTQKSAIDELMAMGMQQSPALLFLLYSLQQLKGLALKRFSTTLEEEESIEGYRTDIYLLQAIKEHFAMHQQLEVDRKVRADAFAEYQENERLIYQERENSKVQALALDKQLESDCAVLEAEEFHLFDQQESIFKIENEKMQEILQDTQSRDRDKELQSIGKKGQSIEEVNDLLWGYEDDITTKMEALSILCEAIKEEEENLHRELICVCMAQILHNSV